LSLQPLAIKISPKAAWCPLGGQDERFGSKVLFENISRLKALLAAVILDTGYEPVARRTAGQPSIQTKPDEASITV
jgi:hypothetical protein